MLLVIVLLVPVPLIANRGPMHLLRPRTSQPPRSGAAAQVNDFTGQLVLDGEKPEILTETNMLLRGCQLRKAATHPIPPRAAHPYKDDDAAWLPWARASQGDGLDHRPS